MRPLARAGLPVFGGLALAVASGWHGRVGPAPRAWDQELCSYSPPRSCRDGVLQSGWPLAYLVDARGVSRVGRLAIGEDHFHPWAFAVDAAVAGALIWLLLFRARAGPPKSG